MSGNLFNLLSKSCMVWGMSVLENFDALRIKRMRGKIEPSETEDVLNSFQTSFKEASAEDKIASLDELYRIVGSRTPESWLFDRVSPLKKVLDQAISRALPRGTPIGPQDTLLPLGYNLRSIAKNEIEVDVRTAEAQKVNRSSQLRQVSFKVRVGLCPRATDIGISKIRI